MESIYWVMCWACHRRCKHCYEGRFRPYVRDELAGVVGEAERNAPLVLANLPPRITYLDRTDPAADGSLPEKTGRIILSGGESLLEGVRQRVTYPVIEGLVTPGIVADLLARGVWMISVAGVDDFHVGMEGKAKQDAYRARLSVMMEAQGMRASGLATVNRKWLDEAGPLFSFFGATPDTWIGKLWPRGRSWENGLSTATLEDNFCNRWSGGLGFLDHRYSGSEVSIEPDGAVYPCCIKTKLPVGNLLEEPLLDILDSLRGDPVYEAISAGQPERMGLAAGWDTERFLRASRTVTPQGQPYANLCIGCDRFHAEVLAPRIAAARDARLAARHIQEATA